MRRFVVPLLAVLLVVVSPSGSVQAEIMRPDDRVTLQLTQEDWVTTKSARVTIAVEAAATGSSANALRADMAKALESVAKAEWRLTSFNRLQDSTGLERWSASFEARLPENLLGSLADEAKRAGRAGLQLGVAHVDFTPTLEEMQAGEERLRTTLYKRANDQLAALNAAFPGRGYRLSALDFNGMDGPVAMPAIAYTKAMAVRGEAMASPPAFGDGLERSKKITLTARVEMAAVPLVAPQGR